MTPVARHRWIVVAAPGREAVAASANPGDRDTVRGWLARGLPLVARARQPEDAGLEQPAGLALPRSMGARKLALRIPVQWVEHVEEPASLEAVGQELADGARDAALELHARARSLGFTARAFGSVAWQWRTGEAYLHAGSDLDVLGAPPTAAALRAWMESLREIAPRMPMRIDGEVEAAGGDAINWRELAGSAGRVLVKSTSGARLVARKEVESQWRGVLERASAK